MGNVTINIQQNCGCCGGSSSGGGSTGSGGGVPGVYLPVILKPTDPNGTPQGYSEITALSDRQCRTAIFLYQWVYSSADGLANTEGGNLLLSLMRSDLVGEALKIGIARAVTPVILVILGLLATALTITIPPSVAAAIALVVGSVFVAFTVEQFSKDPVSTTGAQATVDKLPVMQDAIICALSKATDGEAAYAAYQSVIADTAYGLESSQQNFLYSLMPPHLLAVLWWQPDWWPSFDDDVLSNITANCCGSFLEGQPLLPSSTEGCQTAWYIVDKLVATFNGVQAFYNQYAGSGWGPNWWPLDDDTTDIVKILQDHAGDYIPAKMLNKATNVNGFYEGVAGYINYQVGWQIGFFSTADLNWQALALYTSGEAATMRTGLRNALDVSDCYDAISVPLFAWIDANIDANLQDFMKSAIDGLILPLASNPGLLNLMFVQDADLAFYASTDCAGGGDPAGDYDPVDCTDTGVYNFASAQYNWVPGSNGSWAANVGFSFDTSSVKQTEIVQQVKHSPASIKLTWNANESGRPVYLYTSDNGVDWAEYSHWDFQPTGEITIGGCIVGKYLKIVVHFWQATWAQISKVEFA